MKIGLVCPYDMFRGGGVQEHVLAQAAELRKRGHDVKIITPRVRGNGQSAPADIIFVGKSVKVNTPYQTSNELGMNFRPNAIDDMLEEEKFDLLHVHEPEIPLLGAQIIAKATCPVVATFHAIHPNTPLARTIETLRIPFARSIFSRINSLTAVSDVAGGFVREQTQRTVHIIPNGIDLTKYKAEYTEHTSKSKQQRIVYIGRLEKRKGVKYLLQAYQLLADKRSDVSLTIIGDGPQRDILEEYVAINHIPHVKFTGYVSEKQKLRYLSQASLFCSPALYGESFGIVLLEAMALGIVTIAGDNPGYSALLQDKGRLSLVNPKDVAEFARRIEIFLDDKELRKQWQDWALTYVKQFDYSKIVDQYELLYKKVIKS